MTTSFICYWTIETRSESASNSWQDVVIVWVTVVNYYREYITDVTFYKYTISAVCFLTLKWWNVFAKLLLLRSGSLGARVQIIISMTAVMQLIGRSEVSLTCHSAFFTSWYISFSAVCSDCNNENNFLFSFLSEYKVRLYKYMYSLLKIHFLYGFLFYFNPCLCCHCHLWPSEGDRNRTYEHTY